MHFNLATLTGEQIRAARSLARIEQTELARRTQLSVETIKRLERIRGLVEANSRTLNAIGGAFEELGIRFAGGGDGSEGVWRATMSQPPKGLHALADRGRPSRQPLYRLIYHSRLEPAFDGPDRAGAFPEDFAVPAGVTGRMLACEGRLLHVIEGELDAMRLTFATLATDPRHTAIGVIVTQPIEERLFADWRGAEEVSAGELEELRQEPALADGFRPERLSPATALGLLMQIKGIRRLVATPPQESPAQFALAQNRRAMTA